MEDKLPTAQAGRGWVRQALTAGRRRRGHRLQHPGPHPAAVHQRTGGDRARDPRHNRRRLDRAVQRDLHLAEGAEEGQGAVGRRNPAAGDHRALRRRRHLEPAPVRGSAGPGQAVGNRDLHDRPAAARRSVARRSRKRSTCCAAGAGNRRTLVLPVARERAAEDLRLDLARALDRCTRWRTPRRTRSETAPGGASSSASPVRDCSRARGRDTYGPTGS